MQDEVIKQASTNGDASGTTEIALVDFREQQKVQIELWEEATHRREARAREETEKIKRRADLEETKRNQIALHRGIQAASFGAAAIGIITEGVGLLAGRGAVHMLRYAIGLDIVWLGIVFVITAILYLVAGEAVITGKTKVKIDE